MQIKTYHLTPRALDDLNNIFKYTFRTWGEDQAHGYWQKLHAAFGRLVRKPQLGKKRSGIRPDFLVYRAERHQIIFRILPEQLEISRILHERMDAQRHLH